MQLRSGAMKTTLNLDDQVLKSAKEAAARNGTTFIFGYRCSPKKSTVLLGLPLRTISLE